MLNQTKHRVTLIEILKDIYSDPDLRTILGFKGGTAAMLFYDLPRLSVDLDFDLLDPDKKEMVFEKIKTILSQHGVLREATDKKYTLFFLVSYEKGEHMIKVDISKRKGISAFHAKSYLGIPVLVMKEGDMVAGKLSALLTRRKFAMRDVFDLWFFLKNKWPVNETVVTEKTGLSLTKGIEQAVEQVNGIDKKQLLQGLGELIDAKQKAWVKNKLTEEIIFYLRLYQEVHGKPSRASMTPENSLSDNIPVLDIEPNLGGTGGPSGHFVHFNAINTGEKVAIDCRWGIRGFAYEWRSPEVFILRSGDKKQLEYKIFDEKPFKEFVPELNIFFEYKDNRGVSYFTRRELILEKVPSDAFYNITKVSTFHPAVILKDAKIKSIEILPKDDDREEVAVKVDVNGELKEIHIGISGSLLAIFGFSKPEEIKAALSELTMRKVRNMLKEDNVIDHLFTSSELPVANISGFEAYKTLRDSLDQ